MAETAAIAKMAQFVSDEISSVFGAEPHRVFLNIDLKSYAKPSITSSAVMGAANNLILAMNCANADRYATTETFYR